MSFTHPQSHTIHKLIDATISLLVALVALFQQSQKPYP